MARLPTHICVTWPQWVKLLSQQSPITDWWFDYIECVFLSKNIYLLSLTSLSTHYFLVITEGIIEFGQHWFRLCLVTRQDEAITWSNIHLSQQSPVAFTWGQFRKKMILMPTTEFCFKITKSLWLHHRKNSSCRYVIKCKLAWIVFGTWIRNYIHLKPIYAITYPWPNFDGHLVNWHWWITTFHTKQWDVFTYPCWSLILTLVVKEAHGAHLQTCINFNPSMDY